MSDLNRISRREEAKRNRAWNPAARWRILQQTMTWAEAQNTARRNTPQRCLALERARLQAASFRQYDR